MARVLLYFAHPGYRYSQANRAIRGEADAIDGITRVDLYAEYPRFEIDIDREQQRLLDHDVIAFQFPFFWYSTPSLIKEWIDLVLEHGFAYGSGGDQLAGKHLLLALTAAGDQVAYSEQGYQHYPIRTFLTPLEQTARLCQMCFLAPYVLYGSLKAPEEVALGSHARGFRRLLEGLRDDRVDLATMTRRDVVEAGDVDALVRS